MTDKTGMESSRFVWEEGDLVLVERDGEPVDEEEAEEAGEAEEEEETTEAVVRRVLSDTTIRKALVEALRKEWDESQHPRNEEGEFTTAGGGGGGEGAPEPKKIPTKEDPEGRFYKDLEVAAAAPKDTTVASPAQIARAKEMVYDKAAAEEPAVTKTILGVAAATGGEAIGLDFKLKTPGSLARKAISDAKADGVSEEAALLAIGDSIRYTITWPADKYLNGVVESVKEMEAQGYRIVRRPDGTPKFKNTWAAPGEDGVYQGINCNFITPEGRQIEVQFHTPDSWEVKEHANHLYYEVWRHHGMDDVNTNPLKVRAAKVMKLNQRMVNRPPKVHLIAYKGNTVTVFEPKGS